MKITESASFRRQATIALIAIAATPGYTFSLFPGSAGQINDNGAGDLDPTVGIINVLPIPMPGGGGCSISIQVHIDASAYHHFIIVDTLTIHNPSDTLTAIVSNYALVDDNYQVVAATGAHWTNFTGTLNSITPPFLAGGEYFSSLSRATRFTPQDVGATWAAPFGTANQVSVGVFGTNAFAGSDSGAPGIHTGFIDFRLGKKESYNLAPLVFNLNVVPEPATLTALGIGIAALLRNRRKK